MLNTVVHCTSAVTNTSIANISLFDYSWKPSLICILSLYIPPDSYKCTDHYAYDYIDDYVHMRAVHQNLNKCVANYDRFVPDEYLDDNLNPIGYKFKDGRVIYERFETITGSDTHKSDEFYKKAEFIGSSLSEDQLEKDVYEYLENEKFFEERNYDGFAGYDDFEYVVYEHHIVDDTLFSHVSVSDKFSRDQDSLESSRFVIVPTMRHMKRKKNIIRIHDECTKEITPDIKSTSEDFNQRGSLNYGSDVINRFHSLYTDKSIRRMYNCIYAV